MKFPYTAIYRPGMLDRGSMSRAFEKVVLCKSTIYRIREILFNFHFII
jgi:ACT domain-containing protein